jgi:putative ABC transport system substrate-binding protein
MTATSRRHLLLFMGSIASVYALGRPTVRRITMLLPSSAGAFSHLVGAFRNSLHELGYLEGRDILIEEHYLNGDLSAVSAKAEDIVRKAPDVIVVSSTPVAIAMKRATQVLPIVVANAGGMQEAGLIASLARPGGNLTGMSSMTEGLIQKQLSLLLEFAPKAQRFGMVRREIDPVAPTFQHEAEEAARALGLKVQALMVNGEGDVEKFRGMLSEYKLDALLVFPDPVLLAARARLVPVIHAARIPAIYPFREYVTSGGMVSYGVNITENYRRAARYVHRIIKGEKPGDLPIQQPSKFELVVNASVVRYVGLTIPASLKVQIDELVN